MRILEILEQVHSTGVVYNDLKLDNILMSDAKKMHESLSDVKLIDFGLCTRYLD